MKFRFNKKIFLYNNIPEGSFEGAFGQDRWLLPCRRDSSKPYLLSAQAVGRPGFFYAWFWLFEHSENSGISRRCAEEKSISHRPESRKEDGEDGGL